MIKDVENFNILTTEEERKFRADTCLACDHFRPSVAICDKCACPFDYIITYKFKICPIEKWN